MLIEHTVEQLYEVLFDGATVWINGGTGECIGRFGIRGVDLHRTVLEQAGDKGECLYCTHSRPSLDEWDTFVCLLKEIYNVDLPSGAKPSWLTAKQPQAS